MQYDKARSMRKVFKSEDVKNAIINKLLEIAPQYAVYKEAMTAPEYPHFFVHLVKADDTPLRSSYHNVQYSFDLRYRVASDPSTDMRLEANLDEMALKLMTYFNLIECTDGTIYRVEDKDYEKTDGVLHFFFKVTAQVLLNDNTEHSKFGAISVNVGVK